MKKPIALILAFCLVFTLCACDGNDIDEPATEDYVLPTPVVNSDVSLPFTSAAGFDPYTTESALNRDLIPLLFEGLFSASTDGRGVPLLAVSGETEGKTVTVKLKQGLLFSDGTELIGSAVRSSFEKAKNSSYYSAQLKNFVSLTLIDNFTLKFEMSKVDPMALNALNFPIVKYSGEACIGSGKYALSYMEEMPYLKVNTNHRDYEKSWNSQIALYDMAGITGPVYPFKSGEISIYKNDLTKGDYVNLSSKTVSIPTDYFVYIGINSLWGGTALSIPAVRKAVSVGINRSVITASSFLGQGTATVTPFPSDFYETEDLELISADGDLEKAVSILEQAGYSKVNEDGIRGNGNVNLYADILVCTENKYKLTVAQSFKEELQKLGFKVEIKEKETAEDFTAALAQGHYSFYVGETRLTPNCDLTEFFTNDGVLSYGIREEFFQTYGAYTAGEITTADFLAAFDGEVPFLPLFYRKAVVSVNPNLIGVGNSENLYSSVSQWKKG